MEIGILIFAFIIIGIVMQIVHFVTHKIARLMIVLVAVSGAMLVATINMLWLALPLGLFLGLVTIPLLPYTKEDAKLSKSSEQSTPQETNKEVADTEI